MLPAAMLFGVAMQASAASITYIQTGHASGTLDGVAFDSDFAITAVSDTDTVASCGASCLYNDNLSAVIYVDSLGPLAVLTPTRYSYSGGVVAFGHAGASGSDLYVGPAFSGWDMASSTGYVVGGAQLLQWTASDVVTTGGKLVFSDAQTFSGFTAAVSQVPLPAGAWLLGSALVGVIGIARRKA